MSDHQCDDSIISSSTIDDGNLLNSESGYNECGNEAEKDETDKIKQELSKRETNAVFLLRILVSVVLLLAAVAVSAVVYMITSKAEYETFATQYDGASRKVIQSFEGIIAKMGSISSVGVDAVIHGMDRNVSWPFITLSSFQQRCATARILSGALSVAINPIVQNQDRAAWQAYAVSNASNWITEAYEYQVDLGLSDFEYDPPPLFDGVDLNPGTGNEIVYYGPNATAIIEDGPGPYLPTWETSPYLRTSLINDNIFRNDRFAQMARRCLDSNAAILGGFDVAPPGNADASDSTTRQYAVLQSFHAGTAVPYLGDPMARLYIPLFGSFDQNRTAGAVMMNIINWRSYFHKVLPNNILGIVIVLENSCDGFFTYEIHGSEAYVVGFGDQHDHKFDYMERVGSFQAMSTIADGTKYGLPLNQDQCFYRLRVYPSQDFAHLYMTHTPIVITFAVSAVFVLAACLFFVYDILVERRQRLVLAKAAQSAAIVSSLFPGNVRDRLFQSAHESPKGSGLITPYLRRMSILGSDANNNNNNNDEDADAQPIADLFPNCTVLFADIAGFTAWSSVREPEQVFVLLQSVYHAFDQIAKRRKVFKVETIGDSYVAVTGLPDVQPTHALIMTRFAFDCIATMEEVARDLETTLGPDTGDLSIRVGLHSGPVTAGVLRGDRARFQLFGDTVNTAARMENTGQPGKIQITQATVDELTLAGKEHWVTPRTDIVEETGKAKLQTFWAHHCAKEGSSHQSSTYCGEAQDRLQVNPSMQNEKINDNSIKQERLVGWMVALLLDHLKKIIARRSATNWEHESRRLIYRTQDGKTYLDEVRNCLVMPKFDAKAEDVEDPRNVVINSDVVSELRAYVSDIASMYRNNPFHNFEHACHVTMSVNKLLSRIVAPDVDIDTLCKGGREKEIASRLYDYTHGINSDPLTLFAITFSALIHDADHRGISNAQLIKEQPDLGAMYRNKSVAEQNSVEVAWNLLMQDKFEQLRKCIFATEDEFLRFRQIVVNVVLATDIFDKELNDLRRMRWNRAFNSEISDGDSRDLKATIVIEHIIQASDVAHTMQHWHIYRKWSKRFFTELYFAFKAGRMVVDPSTFWYKGELGFFDNYIIPLAKKLKECHVFGVCSDEYLNYAIRNRIEWEVRGRELVEEMVQEVTEAWTASQQ